MLELCEKKVSIIIPCYNQELYIAEAIESVLNQTYQNIEIVVINDASTDNSEIVINTYAQKYRNIVFLNTKENKGVVFCRNLAISKSSGEYILPLDGDDKIAPTFVEKAVFVLNNNQDVRIAYSKVKFFGDYEKEFKLEPFSPDRILFCNCITNTSMYRKSDFILVGGYKENMKDGLEDWDLWLSFLEISKNKESCAFRIDEVLFYYRKLKTHSRTKIAIKNQNSLYANIIMNHFDLFFSNESFFEHILKNTPILAENRNKKLKLRTRFLYLLFLIVVFQTMFLLYFLLFY